MTITRFLILLALTGAGATIMGEGVTQDSRVLRVLGILLILIAGQHMKGKP